MRTRLLRLAVRLLIVWAFTLGAFAVASVQATVATSFSLLATAAAFGATVVARDNVRAALQGAALVGAVALVRAVSLLW